MSSRRPPPLVAPGSCSSRAARRGFAGAEPYCIPSCTAARPPRPGAARSWSPQGAQRGRPGARRRRAAAERDEVAGREAGCSTTSLSAGEELRLPFVSKCKHCPLLSRPRQRARHTGSHTWSSCRAHGVFREGAGRAEPPLGKFPRRPSTRGVPGGPQGARLDAEAANAPSTTLGPPKGRTAGKSGVPTRGGGRRGAGGLRTPRAFPQRRRQRPPPRPWGRAGGTFPAWTRAKKTRSPAEGAEGLRRAGGKHQRRAVWEPERGRARGAEENRQVWGVLGTRTESHRRRRVVSQP